MRRVHPLYIIKLLLRFWFIILLPFFEALFLKELDFTPANTLPAVFMTVIAFLEWRGFRYEINDKQIIVIKGIIFRMRRELLLKRISTADIDIRPLLSLFGCAELRADTESGSGKQADIKMLIGKREALLLLEQFCGDELRRRYRAPAWKTAMGALAFSRSAPGLLLLSPVLKVGGQLLGEGFNARIYGTVSSVQSLLGEYIPPVFAAAAYLVAAGRLISFLHLSLRQMNFQLGRAGQYIITRRGLLAKRYTVIYIPMAVACVTRQTPLMRCFGLSQVLLDSAGYGKEEGELAVLIPAEAVSVSEKIRSDILPEMNGTAIDVQPPANSRRRYIYPALFWLSAMAMAELLILKLLPEYSALSGIILLMPTLYCFLFIIMRINAHKEAGLSRNQLTCAGYRSLVYYRAVFSKRVQPAVIIKQNPLQRIKRLCNIRLIPCSDSRLRAQVKHLSADSLSQLDGICDFTEIKQLKKRGN